MITTDDHRDHPAYGKARENGEIAIDAISEVSEEEQREILTQIENHIEKNRKSFFAGREAQQNLSRRYKAKKSGGLFPILVNVFAVAALAAGFLALSSIQGQADVQARGGTRIFSDVERALIEEIRRETNSRLASKDQEIASILALLARIDRELQELLAGDGVLTPEQLATQNYLKALQNEHRSELATAREERAQILNDARSQEAVLHAQLDIRTRGLAETAGRQTDELYSARHELARLSTEQAQTATVESQIAAFFAGVHRHVAESNFDAAEQTIAMLREFLNTPAFQGLRAIQSRRELYLQAIETLETLLEEHRVAHNAALAGLSPPDRATELRLQNEVERLERVIAEMEGQQAGNLAAGILSIQAEHEAEVGRLQEENERLHNQLQQAAQRAMQLLQLQQALPQ